METKKQLSTRQWAAIKRTAQNVLPLLQRKEKLQKYVEELETINAQIEVVPLFSLPRTSHTTVMVIFS